MAVKGMKKICCGVLLKPLLCIYYILCMCMPICIVCVLLLKRDVFKEKEGLLLEDTVQL